MIPSLYLLDDHYRDHVFGRTEHVVATVESVREDGRCRSSTDYEVEVSWTPGPVPGHGEYTVCGRDPDVGESIDVWVTSTGHVITSSPRAEIIGIAAIAAVLGLSAVGTGAALIVQATRRRRRVRAAAGARLSPPIPVQVKSGGKGSALRVYGLGPNPYLPTTGVRAAPVIRSADGAPPKAGSSFGARGRWWMRLGPIVNRRQPALLVTGTERQWIEILRM